VAASERQSRKARVRPRSGTSTPPPVGRYSVETRGGLCCGRVSIGAIPRLLFALFLLRPIILPESAAEPVAA
jgi:hypothetical protein